MDVVIGIIWRVVLHDPVDLREVKSTLGHICANQDAFLALGELEVGASPLLLLLLAMNLLDRGVDIIEQVRVELDSIAAGHENHDLLLQVLA